MKTLISVWSLILGTFIVSANAFASHDIEGRWKNARTNVGLEVEKTYDGIRVKRLDKANWIRYESIRSNQFKDRNGNTYALRTDGVLEWESYDGRKRLRFTKDDYHIDGYTYPDRTPDKYVERNHYYGKDKYRTLEGKWINKSTGQAVWVKVRSRHIKVKAHRGGWITFKPRHNRSFVDDHGNRYQLRNGKLAYTSYSGDFYMRFVRY